MIANLSLSIIHLNSALHLEILHICNAEILKFNRQMSKLICEIDSDALVEVLTCMRD